MYGFHEQILSLQLIVNNIVNKSTALQFDYLNLMKNEDNNNFKFTSEFMKCVKYQEFSTIDPFYEEPVQPPIMKKYQVGGSLLPLNSRFVTSYETKDYIIYCFVQWDDCSFSYLKLQIFEKEKGHRFEKVLPEINGQITAVKITYLGCEKDSSVHDTMHGICLVLGCENGEIKIITLNEKTKIEAFRIQSKPIIDLVIDEGNNFPNKKVCFALIDDYSIFVIHLEKRISIGHFRPTIIMCDQSLSLSLHESGRYLLESTKGGYLILWKINSSLFEDDKQWEQNQKEKKKRPKAYNVFPLYILHSASVDGLIWSSFFGDCIAIITKNGYFKLIALNIEDKEEHAVLLEYKIEDKNEIRRAIMFQKQECLAVVKKRKIEFLFFSEELRIHRIVEMELLKNIENQMEEKFQNMEDFLISEDFEIILGRSPRWYFINKTNVIKNQFEQKGNSPQY